MDAAVSPDLAEKVLSADLRNIVKKVSDGGTLTSGERDLMRQFSLTQDMARQARLSALLAKWADGGRLSQSEVTEIRSSDPAFSEDSARPTTPLSSDAPDPGERRFTLDPPPRRDKLSREQLDRWGALYGTEHRQIRRWHRTGVEKNDPCPFDSPHRMPAWWGRCMKQRVPDKILAAAAAAPPESEGGDGQSAPEKTKSEGAEAADRLGGFDLNGVEAVEGEAVRQARQLSAAAYSKLGEAYTAGDHDGIQQWQVRWERAVEALRKQERDDREAQKQRGILISRASVESDIGQAIAMLKVMRESMAARIVARLHGLPPDILEPLRLAIEAERIKEDDLMRNLDSVASPADVDFRLAA